MAKRDKINETDQGAEAQPQGEAQGEAVEAGTAAAPSTITIQGLNFAVPTPYAEGHTLTAPEANALNNLLGENLRNNFAAQIKKILEPKDAPKREVAQLTAEELAKLQTDFAAYAAEYKLSGKRSAKAPVDPVEREAVKIAREQIDTALRNKKIDKKSLAEGAYDNYVQQLLAQNPAIRDEARAYIARLQTIGSSALDSILPSAPVEAAAA